MRLRQHTLIGAAILALAGAGVAVPPLAVAPAYAACDPGTRVDNSTAAGTTRLMRRAGYTNIKIDQKGCDNVWHVFASKDGKYGRYAVEPDGRIFPEGN